MRLPIEVVADRPEEVVDVSDLVAQALDGLGGFAELAGLIVGGVAELLLQRHLLLEQVDGVGDLGDLGEQIVRTGLLERQALQLGGALQAHLERDRGVIQRGAQRAGDGLHHRHPGDREHRLGQLLQHQHAGRVAQVAVGFDHQQLGVEPGCGEVPFGGGVADVGRCAGRQIGADVVAGLVARQGDQPDERHPDRHGQHRPGPADHHRADAPPALGPHGPLGVEHPQEAAQGQDGRREGERGQQCHRDADRGGHREASEVGQPGEAQAVHRADDRQARAQHHVGGAAVGRVVGLFSGLPGVPGFLEPADQEDRVVGAGGDREQRQQVRRIYRQPDDVVVRQHRDHPARRGHLDGDHDQGEPHRGDASVNPQQHQRDDREGDEGDFLGTL